ncbi:MAG TPA: hypothetical protein VK933_14020 [Longimicrobiales bacterium]|nr:hypothetical protein [Longimicrobiales bacterium]
MRCLAVLAFCACFAGACGTAESGGAEADGPAPVAHPVDWDAVFGVVAWSDEVVCMRVPARAAPARSRVAVVLPLTGRVIVASVGPELASCPGDVSGEDATFHRLEASWEPGDLGIAILEGDAIATHPDLDGDGVPESFRACTSSEGVHLSVWSGEPLRGRRLWQYYYYLGYDVEPDCTDEDFAEQERGAA